MIFSLESNGQAQTKGSPPVIPSSYAQERIRGGEEWRVYISASEDSQLRSGFEISADNGKIEFTF